MNFHKLKKIWYKRLKNSGFDDQEDEKGNLKADTDHRTIAYALQVKGTREGYYRTARVFLITHNFSTSLEKLIWERHCEGIGRRTIAKELKVTAYKVEKIVISLSTKAGLRKW